MIFYRYEAIHYEYGSKLILKEYEGVKETPCGWWIQTKRNFLPTFKEKRKWVSLSGRKRYAYPTIEEAQINFKTRRLRYIDILRSRLYSAQEELWLIKKLMEPKETNNE